jgi:hypothetical protein
MSSTYRECADLCSRLSDACTSEGIGVTVKNATPIWFSLSASGEGIDVEIEHIDPNYTGRYENDCFCFSDRTDRRKTKLTLCPERLKAGQVLTFRNCKINLIYADVSLRRILSTLSNIDRVEAPAGSVCEVKGNRFRHMGSNRLLVGGKVVAYKYPALGGWSDKYTHRLEVSHVIIE